MPKNSQRRRCKTAISLFNWQMHNQIHSRFDSAAIRRRLEAIQRIFTMIVLLTLAIPLACFSQSSTLPGKAVWSWLGECDVGKMIGIDVFLNRRSIYHSGFRACLIDREDAKAESQQRHKQFYFSGGHTFQGQYHTKESDKIEGDIWQAGADPDGILLGLSFANKDQVLLNTIHIAKPGKASQTKVDSGIVVKTYPLRIELQ
jgi:hypothetical protein